MSKLFGKEYSVAALSAEDVL